MFFSEVKEFVLNQEVFFFRFGFSISGGNFFILVVVDHPATTTILLWIFFVFQMLYNNLKFIDSEKQVFGFVYNRQVKNIFNKILTCKDQLQQFLTG